MDDEITYFAKRHETGKKNRYYIVRRSFWGFSHSHKVVKKWLKHSEVQAWLDLLKED